LRRDTCLDSLSKCHDFDHRTPTEVSITAARRSITGSLKSSGPSMLVGITHEDRRGEVKRHDQFHGMVVGPT